MVSTEKYMRSEVKTFAIKHCNTPCSHSRYCTGIHLQWRLMRRNSINKRFPPFAFELTHSNISSCKPVPVWSFYYIKYSHYITTFEAIFRRFSKTFLNFFESQTNVSDHFPKTAKDDKRRSEDPKMFQSHTRRFKCS